MKRVATVTPHGLPAGVACLICMPHTWAMPRYILACDLVRLQGLQQAAEPPPSSLPASSVAAAAASRSVVSRGQGGDGAPLGGAEDLRLAIRCIGVVALSALDGSQVRRWGGGTGAAVGAVSGVSSPRRSSAHEAGSCTRVLSVAGADLHVCVRVRAQGGNMLSLDLGRYSFLALALARLLALIIIAVPDGRPSLLKLALVLCCGFEFANALAHSCIAGGVRHFGATGAGWWRRGEDAAADAGAGLPAVELRGGSDR